VGIQEGSDVPAGVDHGPPAFTLRYSLKMKSQYLSSVIGLVILGVGSLAAEPPCLKGR
jgi:hypothetical protein